MFGYAPWMRQEPEKAPHERLYIDIPQAPVPCRDEDEDDADRGAVVIQIIGEEDE